ncbi:MAG TPA: tetratricopeptide repeat protein, partial [Humisphaera sp.]
VDMLGGTEPAVFTELRNRAEQLARTEPNNTRARIMVAVATVQQRLLGLPVPDAEVAGAEAELRRLAARDPGNSDAPFALARLKVKAGRDLLLRNREDAEPARGQFAQAAQIMSAALERQDANPLMQYRAFHVFRMLGIDEARLSGRYEQEVTAAGADAATGSAAPAAGGPTTAPAAVLAARPTTGPAAAAPTTAPSAPQFVPIAAALDNAYGRQAVACIERAVTALGEGGKAAGPAAPLVAAAQPKLHEIYMFAASTYEALSRLEDAKALKKRFFEHHPDNQHARLMWAKQLAVSQADRPRAIEILSQDVPIPNAVGMGIQLRQSLRIQTLTDLVRIRLLDYRPERDPARRKAIMDAVDQDMSRLRRIDVAGGSRVLAAEGRVLLEKGDRVGAVRVLSQAYQGMLATNAAKDHETMLILAQTYVETGQPGSAIDLYAEVVREDPSNFGARMLLVRELINARRLAGIDTHLNYLNRHHPGNPEVNRLAIAVLIERAHDPAFAEAVLRQLPEANNGERRVKYEVARQAGKIDLQIDLLKAMIVEDPKEVVAYRALVALYREKGLVERAKETVGDGLRVAPDDAVLLAQRDALNGATNETVLANALKKIQAEPDAYKRNRLLYDFYRQQGKPDQALAAANDALRAAPPGSDDAATVHAVLYEEYLARRDWLQAQAHRDALVRADYDKVGGRLITHRWHVARGEYAQAEAVARDAVDQFRDFAQTHLALGQAVEAQGKWPEAIRSFNEVLLRQPTNYEALRALVDTLYNAGRTEEAGQRLADMRNLFPNDTVVRELWLGHLANFGKPEQAIPERRAMLERNPKDPWNYLALAATYFKDAQRLGGDKPAERDQQVQAAFNVLQAGSNQFPDDPRFVGQAAEIYRYNNRVDSGEEILKRFCERELGKRAPARIRPEPWLVLADFYASTDQQDKAVDALGMALTRSEGNLDVRLKLVGAMVQARRYEQAMQTLQPVADNPDPRVGRAKLEVLVAQGSMKEAEQAIVDALKVRDGADLRNLLASVLIDLGRTEEAAKHVDRAIELDQKNETSVYLRALVLARGRPSQPREAIKVLDYLVKRWPRNVPGRLLQSDLYVRTGQLDLAQEVLADGVLAMPGNRDLRLNLVRLYRGARPPKIRLARELVAAAENDPVLKTDPTWPREAAQLYAMERKVPEAVQKMRAASAQAPDNVEYRRELIDMLLQLQQYVGAELEVERLEREGHSLWWMYHQRGVAKARQASRPLSAQARARPEVQAELKALRDGALAQFDRALTVVDAATASTPIAAATKAATAETVLKAIGATVGYDEALARLKPRLGNDPDNRWRLLSIVFRRSKGDYAGATAEATALLADPSNAKTQPARRLAVLAIAAEVYQARRPDPDFDRAKATYTEMLALDPDNVTALNNLAFMVAENGPNPDPKAARTYSERAYRLALAADANPYIMDTHAWVLVLAGGAEAEQGLNILKDVVEAAPNFIEGRYHLAEAYYRRATPDLERTRAELTECEKLITYEDELGNPVDEKLRTRVMTLLGKVKAR